jgi:hypothetical protein
VGRGRQESQCHRHENPSHVHLRGIGKRSVEPDNVTRLRLVQSGVNPAVYSPSPPSL